MMVLSIENGSAKRLFTDVDLNRDNMISRDELVLFCTQNGIKEDEFVAVFDALDKLDHGGKGLGHRDGKCDLDELMDGLSQRLQLIRAEEADVGANVEYDVKLVDGKRHVIVRQSYDSHELDVE